MKPISCLFILLIAVLSITLQCKKKKEEPQLPPATTSGEMIFGCKINGEIFVPRDGNGKPGLYVQYVNLGDVPDGGWHLNIPAYNYKTKRGVSIETDSLLLEEGKTYEYKTTRGTANSFYIEDIPNGVDVYPKLDEETGSLHVTRFDRINRILSGTFSFVGTNSTGKKVNVTEGRFDIRY